MRRLTVRLAPVCLGIVLLGSGWHAHANSIYFDLIAGARHATVVAEVQVTATRAAGVGTGEVLEGASDCGTITTAVVLNAVKGAKTGDIVSFGRYSGREIGGRYVVFLAKAGTRLDSTYNYFRDSLFSGRWPPYAEERQRERCEPLLPVLRESGEGLGTVRVQPLPRLPGKTGVVLSTSLYRRIPASLPGACDRAVSSNDPSEELCPGGNYEVPVHELLEMLSGALKRSEP